MIRFLAAAFAAAMLAAPAHAATVSFDFTGGGGQSRAVHSLGTNGLGLSVGGFKCTGTCRPVDVQHWSAGFGIRSGRGDSHQIDGANGDEILSLAFDRSVTITSLLFGYADSGDDVSVLRVASGTVVQDAAGPLTLLGGGLGAFTVTNGTAGTFFGVAALGNDDAFKLRGVTVRYDEPTTALPPVPLPAAGWMLLAGIGGLAAARRRGRA